MGGLLSGSLYGSMSDKYMFLRDYLVSKGLGEMDSLLKMDEAVLFTKAQQEMNMSASELTNLLYTTYHPGSIWLLFAAIGLGTAFLLFVYDRFILKYN